MTMTDADLLILFMIFVGWGLLVLIGMGALAIALYCSRLARQSREHKEEGK